MSKAKKTTETGEEIEIEQSPNANKHYEEWSGRNNTVKVNGENVTTFKKLEKIKDVWISETTANTLNASAESPNAANPIMYIPA